MLYSAAYRILGLQTAATFQVVLDSLALTPCYSAFLTTTDVPKVYMHQFWDSIHKSALEFMVKTLMNFPLMKILCLSSKNLVILGKSSQSPMLLLIRCINLGEHLPLSSTEVYLERQLVLTSFILTYSINPLGNALKKNEDYVTLLWEDSLTNNLNTKEESQIYGGRLPKSMTSPEMQETKAYKTYIGYAIGVTPPNKVRKFKKPTSPKLSTVPVSSEEPTRKSKRVKRHAKKSSNAPTTSVVIRDTSVMSSSKKKEKVTVEKCKGIKLLSEVTLTEEAQFEEVCKMSMREKLKMKAIMIMNLEVKEVIKREIVVMTIPNLTMKKGQILGMKLMRMNRVLNLIKRKMKKILKMMKKIRGRVFKTPSNDTDDEDETKIKDKAEGDEDEGMDYTTNQFDDDMDLRMNEPVNIDEGFIQNEGSDSEMINVQQGNEKIQRS
ncbi:hypothetical protein Tco_0116203 [Tanacetum coccineum]